MGKRGNHEGTIYHRKDGKWEAKATIGYSDDGKPKRLTKYFKTRQEAAAWLAEAQTQQNAGQFVQPDKITVGEWMQKWLPTYAKPKIRANSYANYHDALRVHILPALGKIPLQKLTTDVIQEFYTHKAMAGREDGKPGGLSPRMLALFHQLINSALKQAVRQKLIPQNPAEWTTKPPVKRKEMSVLNADQINTYIATARNHRLFAAFVLDLTTGLRRGELLALKRDALDLTRGTMTVREGLYRTRLVDEGRSELQFNAPKTESGKRTVPLRAGVVRELREHLKRQAEERLFAGGAWRDDNLVFCTPIGTPVEPRNFYRCHTEILKKAGIPHVSLHALRHSFASLVADTGENPENLRAILGHSKTSTTMDLYCHTNEEGKRRAVNRLDGLINF